MHLLDLLFPKRCVGCGRIGRYICSFCTDTIVFPAFPLCPMCLRPAIDGVTHPACRTPWGLDGLYVAASYQGVLRRALRRMKYQLVWDLQRTVGHILFSRYPNTLPRFDFFAPVPLHRTKQRERGFNQSTLIARFLGQSLHVPVSETLLVRIRPTRAQFGLTKRERKHNIQGAFACSSHAGVFGTRIGLVDDVATTMATLSECGKVLKRNGARVVWGIVLAHG